MAMTPYSGDTSVIGKLGTTPQERGLTTQEFKDKFDEGLKEFVEWFNFTHLGEIDERFDELQEWQTVDLQNDWTADGGIGIKYFKHFGIVYLNIRLIAGSGASHTLIGTLPAGYRPISNMILPVYDTIDRSINYLVVVSDGAIRVLSTTTFTPGSLYIGSISFRADK